MRTRTGPAASWDLQSAQGPMAYLPPRSGHFTLPAHRYPVLRPDRAGNFLEPVVLDRPHGPAVIHAMRMRATYRRLLTEGRGE